MKRISPTGDLAFKKVFASEDYKGCLSGLIIDFFGVEVSEDEITIVNPYSISDYKEVVQGEEVSVLRHTLKDVTASLRFSDFISEMQIKSTRFFDERALYYPFDRFCKNYNKQGFVELDSNEKPNRYSSLIPVYTLNILVDSHFQDDEALRIFELYDPKRNKRYKKELVKVGFFELNKSIIETKNQQYWCDYFLTGEAHPDAPVYIKKASQIIEYANLSEEEKIVSAVLEKARADYDAGFSSAYNDGIEKGKNEEKAEIAKDMLKENEPIEKIIRFVRLDKSTIIKLQTELDDEKRLEE